MSEEALDLSNDIINNNNLFNGRDNNRSRLVMANNEYRSNENVFCSETKTEIKDSLLPVMVMDQDRSVVRSEPNKVALLGNENSFVTSHIKVESNTMGEGKMAEYFVHAYQEQQQLGQLHSLLASLLACSPSNVMAPWLSTKTALSSILHQLPAPNTSPTLLSFSSLHSLYANIQSTCLSLDKLLEQYFLLFISAFLKSAHDKNLLGSLPVATAVNAAQSHNDKPSLKRKAQSPLRPPNSPSPIDYHTDNNNGHSSLYTALSPDHSDIPSYLHSNNSRLFKRKKTIQNGNKKSNFRGTSEAENEIDLSFLPREVNGEIILCDEYMSVRLEKEVYNTLTSKAPRSATRLIRLLMKHFFSQDTLARSSLSGEGIYKDRLKPEVIEAIKIFIKRRHPKLKNGSINLCMTDVCVQARRVNKNQRTRLPCATDHNSKTAASITSDVYSPTMFVNSCADYNIAIPKSSSPRSINNSLSSSSGHQHTSCPSPPVPLSTANNSVVSLE